MEYQKLFCVLANSYGLYLKTQCYHWNVLGNNFYSLHKLFEEQYQDLALAVDEMAEKIRSKGNKVPASFRNFLDALVISEGNDSLTDKEMVKDLQQSNDKLCALIEEAIRETSDLVLIDFLTDRLTVHQKNSWFLVSICP